MAAPRLNLIVLRVADLDRTAAFYMVLGLTFDRHAHGKGPVHLSAESGGVVLEFYPLTSEQPATTGARIGFAVPDVDSAFTRLTAEPGAQAISPPRDSEWGRRAVVADPDGHRVELTQHVQ